MSPSFLATLAAFAFLPLGHPKPGADQAYEQGRWRLDTHRDTFRQELRCHLSDDYGHFPGITARSGALVLKLPSHADGARAWFSIDEAPARPWRDVEAGLVSAGALAKAEALDNATDGVLALPYDAVARSNAIIVQTREGGPQRRYDVSGLWAILASAKRLGCNLG